MNNKDFLNNTTHNFIETATEKKLILFGTGYELSQMYPALINDYQLAPAYCVDNDYRKWYSRAFGLKIVEPKMLEREDKGDIVVLITSVHMFSIKEQLENMGITNYFSSVLFLERHFGKRQFMVHF